MLFTLCGCKVNQYETNAMIQEFLNHGYEIGSFEEKADIYIVNTCTVTNISDKKSRQVLRRTKLLNPDSLVVACGCYAQVGKENLEQIPEIDLILGINEKNHIVEYVEEHRKNNEKEEIVTDVMQQAEYLEFGSITYTEKTRAVVKIQDGCDRFCSYCIIPYARGRVRSRKMEDITNEVESIATKGIKEIVITGIHIASYGKDFRDGTGLIDLLEKINEITGIQRIRLGSLEPMIITEVFLQRLAKLNKVCHHFHLSLQSGCDETLKRMNRKYTTTEFEEVTQRLRKTYEDVILTTDIIVGFPGETESEFEQTYEFLSRINFYKMHVFKYSPRKGTKAAVMPSQVDGNVKEERSNRLIALSDENEKVYQDMYLGKMVDVLWEEKEGEFWKGHTANYILAQQKTEEILEGKITAIEVVGRKEESLLGKE